MSGSGHQGMVGCNNFVVVSKRRLLTGTDWQLLNQGQPDAAAYHVLLVVFGTAMRSPRPAPWPIRVFSILGKVANRGKKSSIYAHLPRYYISMLHDETEKGTRKIDVIRSRGCFLCLPFEVEYRLSLNLREKDDANRRLPCECETLRLWSIIDFSPGCIQVVLEL